MLRLLSPLRLARVRGFARAFSSTSTSTPAAAEPPTVEEALATKKFYVSTPIFYVNGAPHIGHACARPLRVRFQFAS